MSNEIVKRENVELITSSAPQSFIENKASHDRCIDFGEKLLAQIDEQGMTDDLDQQAAQFITKAKNTVKMMNERRAPITKLFDEIRAQFTTLENEIDATKKDTIPYKLQVRRNEFAAKKREEAERQRQEELRRQQIEAARSKYRSDCEAEFRAMFDKAVNEGINSLNQLSASVTLDNYDTKFAEVKNFCCLLPDNWETTLTFSVFLPTNVPNEELKSILQEVLEQSKTKYRDWYKFELESTRDSLLNTLPSKKVELEKLSVAAAEEAERIKANIAEREAQEAARAEEQRRAKAEEEKQATQMQQQAQDMGSLFDVASAGVQAYQPKTSVKKKLTPLSSEAFLPIISMWWTQEGVNLSVEELTKMFKKQITFCEKQANLTEPIFIKSEHIRYDEEVKAK